MNQKIEITEEDFKDFEAVRKSGVVNMFDKKRVITISENLNNEKYDEIIEHYTDLEKKFLKK